MAIVFIRNLSRFLPHTSPAGRLVRLPLSLVPNNKIVPILTGINKGMKWITGSGTSRACWLGNYEADHLTALTKLVRPGMTVYDVGANAGFYTLAFSRLVGSSGRVFAFEPEATNVQFLRRHVKVNRLKNVTIVQVAISSQAGMVPFEGSFGTGSIAQESFYLVPSISLDQFEGPQPSFIKMDIEGAEVLALRGARGVLGTSRPALCIATHSEELKRESKTLLASLGYRFTGFDCASDTEDRDFIALNTRTIE